MVAGEGSDLWVDTMVILKASEHKDAACDFVNFILDADTHRWAAETILYKVPNAAAMSGVQPSLIESFPNMGMAPAEMLKYKRLRDVGAAQRDYSRLVSEIKAANWPRPRADKGPVMPTDRRPLLLMAPALFWLSALMVVPCLLILVLAFFRRGVYGGIEYIWTFENIALVLDPLNFGIFLKSAGIAGLSATIACVLGYAAAYAIAAMPRRHQPWLLFLAVLPFWSNNLVRTYAWIVLLNREGLIAALAHWMGYPRELPRMLYTEEAVVIGLVYNYLPFVIPSCYAPLSRLNPEIAEASRDLGGSGWTTFRRITLPMTVPGIATGFVFVFVLSIGNFVTPALLGGGQFQMIGNLVYAQFLTANDWPFGATLSLVLITIMLGLLLGQAMLAERAAGRHGGAHG